MAFGAYPEVSLADARKRRDEDRAQIAASKDPSQEKERVQVRQRAEAIALTLFARGGCGGRIASRGRRSAHSDWCSSTRPARPSSGLILTFASR